MFVLWRAEEDFRSNDRDGNGVDDFWTANVYGLYGLVTPEEPHGIRLIERDMALAEAPSDTGAYPAQPRGNGATYRGYLIRRFDTQDDGAPNGASTLLKDTDRSGARLHDRSRFAFMTCPLSLDEGRLLFIGNADNRSWKYNLPATYQVRFTPMCARGDSTSAILGTGRPALGNGRTFRRSPAWLGCSKGP